MKTITEHPYVVRDERILNGEPIIKGTRIPVRAVVELWRMSVSPEEITVKLPYLSLAKVFDALGYYHDHTDEINDYIEKNLIPESLIDPLVRDL